MKSSDFQTEFCSIVSLCIVNAWKYTQCVIWIYACARVRCHLSSSRAQAQCQAGRGYFARSPPFLVYIPKVKIAPLKETKNKKTETTKGTHACMNIIRVLLGGRKKTKLQYICTISWDKKGSKGCSRTTNTTRAKWVIITVMMIITNHPSREKIKFEQIICWLILPLSGTHRELSWLWLSG